MLPDIEPFMALASPADVVVGAVTYPACAVIYNLPGSMTASDMSTDTPSRFVGDSSARIDVRKDQVPALAVGSTITGAMDGMPTRTYRVSHVESADPQFHHAWVR